MNLIESWKELLENQTDETFDKFWEEYSKAEINIYSYVLENKNTLLEGTVKDLAEKFNCREVIFMGFLDGVNSSLEKELDLEKIDENTKISLDINKEKLFYNMLVANADHLFSLEQWDEVLSEDKRREIYKDFKRSKIVHVEKGPGRNDPCPCGSGKKYKKCCGKNL